MEVRPKKHLGQHFLHDEPTAQRIAEAIMLEPSGLVIEIGPGTGVLTKYLLPKIESFKAIEIDNESIAYLKIHFKNLELIEGDFLKLNLSDIIQDRTAIVGNFPYNISSQIFFKVLEHRNQVHSVVGMIQKEVAERIAEGPGTKVYGILSVLLQTYYDIEYLFTVHENVFTPPPKVKSGVIRLTRNQRSHLPCNESLFIRIVKESFNQRRKMIRASLRKYMQHLPESRFSTERPEQLSVEDFIELCLDIEQIYNQKEISY